VLAAAVFLFIKAGKLGRWIITILAITVFLPIFLFVFAMPLRITVIEQIGSFNHNNPQQTEPAPAIWAKGIETQFKPETPGSMGSSEKIWVENFTDYVNRNPAQKWILARSQQPSTTETQAIAQAMDDASRKISRLLNEMPNKGPILRPPVTVTRTDILNAGLITDRFGQSFLGSAGTIYRHALLIDASPQKLTQLANQNMTIWQAGRTRLIRDIISAAGIMILICLVYLFLNAATRGYYTWSLRIAATVLILATLFLILKLG